MSMQLFILLVTSPLWILVAVLIIQKIFEDKIYKPHIYRDVKGQFYVRAYSVKGYRYLEAFTYTVSKFTDKNSADRFKTLEDAAQAFEKYQDQMDALKKAKQESGIVHRF